MTSLMQCCHPRVFGQIYPHFKIIRPAKLTIMDALHAGIMSLATIIRQNILAGTVGPEELTISVLESQIKMSWEGGDQVFIIDGKQVRVLLIFPILYILFIQRLPRNRHELELFGKVICPLALVVVLQCSEQALGLAGPSSTSWSIRGPTLQKASAGASKSSAPSLRKW